jgi:hypothetical protein
VSGAIVAIFVLLQGEPIVMPSDPVCANAGLIERNKMAPPTRMLPKLVSLRGLTTVLKFSTMTG